MNLLISPKKSLLWKSTGKVVQEGVTLVNGITRTVLCFQVSLPKNLIAVSTKCPFMVKHAITQFSDNCTGVCFFPGRPSLEPLLSDHN